MDASPGFKSCDATALKKVKETKLLRKKSTNVLCITSAGARPLPSRADDAQRSRFVGHGLDRMDAEHEGDKPSWRI